MGLKQPNPLKSTFKLPSRAAAEGRGLASCGLVAIVVGGMGCAAAGQLRTLHDPLPVDDEVPFDRLHQKSVHNAYDRDEPIGEQLREHGFRSLELDIHPTKLGQPTLKDDWWVYHFGVPGFDGSSCASLGECLGEVRAFHREAPEHEVLTVFIDLKDSLESEGHRPGDLDARVRRSLPAEAIVEPADLMRRCPAARSLREAVAGACSWPTVGELRGRIFIVLTGGDRCDPRSPVSRYAEAASADGVAFVAPRVNDACSFQAQARSGDNVFFNLDAAAFRHARAISRAHLVSRGFSGGLGGGIDDPSQWADALESGVNILATDQVDAARAPWTDALGVTPGGSRRAVASTVGR